MVMTAQGALASMRVVTTQAATTSLVAPILTQAIMVGTMSSPKDLLKWRASKEVRCMKVNPSLQLYQCGMRTISMTIWLRSTECLPVSPKALSQLHLNQLLQWRMEHGQLLWSRHRTAMTPLPNSLLSFRLISITQEPTQVTWLLSGGSQSCHSYAAEMMWSQPQMLWTIVKHLQMAGALFGIEMNCGLNKGQTE